ncbi:hypothetical protein BTR23_15330 [Alkalihalophilus pseudofirmus]|uniref:DUF3267 domain-containing protein n=1 Tax=Alkalihalobacterium alkalinitrilicum TaxID=427920 RepID=UPI00094DB2BE|nr:DUF3267 domain-containing protein [Alkalihalobacterium alkalinitrilicum]OLO36437.1 hypothetical protein BTR23_15330 [Alkalihalophilus pseudofirmus]
MFCWKSVNITREFGNTRLKIVSITSAILFFLIYYLFLSSFIDVTNVNQYGVLSFIIGLFLVPLIHKLLHCVPIWLCGKKAKLTIKKRKFMPILFCFIPNTISKRLCITASLFPLIMITTITTIGSIVSPEHLPYFVIYSAINFGLSIYDIIYVNYLIRAPKSSFIEDHYDEFHILLNRAS